MEPGNNSGIEKEASMGTQQPVNRITYQDPIPTNGRVECKKRSDKSAGYSKRPFFKASKQDHKISLLRAQRLPASCAKGNDH